MEKGTGRYRKKVKKNIEEGIEEGKGSMPVTGPPATGQTAVPELLVTGTRMPVMGPTVKPKGAKSKGSMPVKLKGVPVMPKGKGKNRVHR